MRTLQDVVDRIRAEYLEMPGLRLTPKQMERLFGIEGVICQAALDSLVASKFLCLNADGHYRRLTDGTIPGRRPAKAALKTETSYKTAS